MNRLRGWSELGAKVDEARQELGDADSVFVFADEYGVTAELSFYVPGQHRAYCLAGGRKMNQYDFWPAPDPAAEHAVFVDKGEKGEVPAKLLALFESVDEPRVVTTALGPRKGQTFTLFLCRGYKGVWPAQEGSTF